MPVDAAASVEVTSAAAARPLLEFRNISKAFGATRALRDVSVDVARGEIVALLGENGAGKSTLIKVLAGVHAADAGSISFCGEVCTAAPQRAPIAFIHQDLGLIDWMTVSENICLSLGYPRRFGLLDHAEARRRAARVLELLGSDIDPDTRINSLNRTEKSLVAISRALAADAELIVLDEPTASLPANEVARLFTCLRRLKQNGVSMIYVSHRLDEVFDIADRVVVMRDGQVVGDRPVAGTTPRDLVLMIVGREPSQIFKRPVEKAGDPRLVLNEVCVGDVGPITARFDAGQVVGLVGLRGAGHEAIGRGLFGLAPIDRGQATLDGEAIAPQTPRQAMARGIMLVWGDRGGGSIVPSLSIRENFFLNPRAAGRGNFAYLSPASEMRAAEALGASMDLRPNDPAMPIEALSGGNQQKVVVGRWLNLKGKVYVFEDPTAGVDVGAKAEIYKLFNDVADSGACILVVSNDFEEIANVCHRALVFDRGRVVAELAGAELSVSALLTAASGRFNETPSPKNVNGSPDAIAAV